MELIDSKEDRGKRSLIEGSFETLGENLAVESL